MILINVLDAAQIGKRKRRIFPSSLDFWTQAANILPCMWFICCKSLITTVKY